eukprot:SAG11_NODE_12298_length_710_cov_1.186579_2_plen_174_part_00
MSCRGQFHFAFASFRWLNIILDTCWNPRSFKNSVSQAKSRGEDAAARARQTEAELAAAAELPSDENEQCIETGGSYSEVEAEVSVGSAESAVSEDEEFDAAALLDGLPSVSYSDDDEDGGMQSKADDESEAVSGIPVRKSHNNVNIKTTISHRRIWPAGRSWTRWIHWTTLWC